MVVVVELVLLLSFVVGGLLYFRVGRSKTEEERDKNKKITLLALSPLILCLIGGVLFGGYWFITSSQSPLNKESSSLSSSSSRSSRSSGSIRSCLSGGERAFEVCVSNNPRGKGRLTCESNWKTKLRSCCNAYPAQATDELQCLSLH